MNVKRIERMRRDGWELLSGTVGGEMCRLFVPSVWSREDAGSMARWLQAQRACLKLMFGARYVKQDWWVRAGVAAAYSLVVGQARATSVDAARVARQAHLAYERGDGSYAAALHSAFELGGMDAMLAMLRPSEHQGSDGAAVSPSRALCDA